MGKGLAALLFKGGSKGQSRAAAGWFVGFTAPDEVEGTSRLKRKGVRCEAARAAPSARRAWQPQVPSTTMALLFRKFLFLINLT